MPFSRRYWIAAMLLCVTASPAVLAEDYWTYTYQGFDITTIVSGGRARALAHDLARLDQALRQVIRLPPRRLLTHIYELPDGRDKALVGFGSGVAWQFDESEVTVVTTPTAGGHDRPYWGALFGYIESLLINAEAERLPAWLVIGVPEVFSNAEFRSDEVRMGSVLGASETYTLSYRRHIPLRALLRTTMGDPQLDPTSDYRQMFDAQSWFLAREVYVEGLLRPQMQSYLNLMRQGKSEEDAFAASFNKMSYEDLDKLLQRALTQPTHVWILKVSDPPDRGQPQHLTVAESEARLAELNLLWSHRPEALTLAAQALQAQPGSERALQVVARANLLDGNFGAALQAADAIGKLAAPSVSALTTGGNTLAALAAAVTTQHASIAVDPDTLRKHSQDDFERAIRLDAEDWRPWAGLASLLQWSKDRAAILAFLARAQPVMQKHPDSVSLARSLAYLSARVGQLKSALQYGEAWEAGALSLADLRQAQRFVERAKAQPR